jgi:predicted methyltransferase
MMALLSKWQRLFVFCIVTSSFTTSLKLKINKELLSWTGCISYHEAKDLLVLRPQNIETLATSPINMVSSIDLGLSTQPILLTDEGLCTTDKDKLLATWAELEMIVEKKQGCYALYDDGSKPYYISTISKSSGIPASLCPPLQSSGAPTMVLGGFTMHRIAGDDMNPTVDTAAKLSCFRFFPGASTLDTCMGLGYTAIGAAKKVGANGRVVTIEYDEASVEMAAHNPWSKGLFDGTLPIEVLQGDSCELVRTFDDNSFNFICHDPPARALTRTDVYGLQFYSELRRVLTKDGMLFHYIGNPDSKESGRLYAGITKRLLEAGFSNVQKAPRAFGLVASGGGEVAPKGKPERRSIFRRGEKGKPAGPVDDHLEAADS